MAGSGSATDDDSTAVQTVDVGSPEVADRVAPALALGRYIVIEELGRGGMGVVHRAYDPRLQREVALKLVRTHSIDEDSEARLVREARAMAQLSHPNVVAVYDVDSDGEHVMLAMEYVQGGTLRDWLSAGERDAEQVVAALICAGRGVAAAHAAGLTHRDFKPANVLMGTDGRIRVTDFGLARSDPADRGTAGWSDSAPGSNDEQSSPLTRAGDVVGTPRYMAPEQHAGDPVTAATDQYALCLTLWEALCGASPFSGKGEALLAAKNAGPGPWPKTVAARPALVAAVCRGLSPRPDERHADMAALLEAISPVPPARRRAWALGAGVLGLVGAIGVAAYDEAPQAAPCQGAQQQLADVWSDAHRAATKDSVLQTGAVFASELWARTAPRIDDWANDWQSMHTEACQATTVRGEQSAAVMDLRMACLDRARQGLSAAVTVLQRASPTTLEKAHAVVDDLPALSRCADVVALQAEVAPPSEADAAAVVAARGQLTLARSLTRAGDVAGGLQEAERAAASAAETDYPPLQTEVSYTLGVALTSAGRYEDAEAAYSDVLEHGPERGQQVLVRDALVRLLPLLADDLGRHDQASTLIALARGMSRDGAQAEAAAANAIGRVLLVAGRIDEAETEYRRALQLWRATHGNAHASVAMVRTNLGNALRRKGDFEGALAEHEQALALRRELYGPSHPDVAATTNNLGSVYLDLGRNGEAERLYRAAHELLVAAYGSDHDRTVRMLGNIGNALSLQGKYEEAERVMRQTVRAYRAHRGPAHPNVAVAMNNLGNLLAETGKFEEAEAELGAATELLVETLGPEHPTTLTLRSNHASTLMSLERLDEAAQEVGEVLAARRKALGGEHPSVALSMLDLAEIALADDDLVTAEAGYRDALPMLEKAFGAEHPRVAQGCFDLGRLMMRQGRRDDALPYLERADSIHKATDVAAGDRGATALGLAKALGSDPAELSRAVGLAELALDLFGEGGPSFDSDRREARAFVREHRRPGAH